MLLHCDAVCGGGVQEGTVPLVQLSACFQSLPLLYSSKLGLSGAGSWRSGFVYTLGPCGPLQWTVLWVSPTTITSTGFYSQRFWGFISPCWNPRLCGLSCSPVVSPGLSEPSPTAAALLVRSSRSALLVILSAQVLISAPYTSLDECVFFNSLVVGPSYSSIFWQFWLYFVFKFVIFLLLVGPGSKVYLLTPPSWPEV